MVGLAPPAMSFESKELEARLYLAYLFVINNCLAFVSHDQKLKLLPFPTAYFGRKQLRCLLDTLTYGGLIT